MPRNSRKFYGDGRWEPVYPPKPLPPEVTGLDRIPTNELPSAVNTVFFGGGWYPLSHYRKWDGYVDGHIVYVSPFYISLRPVSIAEWKAVMGSYDNPKHHEGHNEDSSAEVTWCEAIEYCKKRSEKEGLEQCYDGYAPEFTCDWNGNGYRLPTEAEFNYATPNFKRRLPARPEPFPKKVDMRAYHIPYFDVGPNYLVRANHRTMFWDKYDRRYFRESPKFDPTGPKEGCGRASRWISTFPWASNNNFKPYRSSICHHTRCQFYVARSRLFDYNLHHTNLLNYIPQWDI
jgi:hypothetical protein